MSDAVNAIDWGAVPGSAGYLPRVAAAGLRALTAATTPGLAADAAGVLAGGGITHDHSSAVFPSAVMAAPIFLDLVEHGHPAARAAVTLLHESMELSGDPGHDRIDTAHAASVRLCCAVADLIHARRDVLTGPRPEIAALLVEARGHWRFEIHEHFANGPDTVVVGSLAGRLPRAGALAGELHSGDRLFVLDTIGVEYAPDADTFEACLRLPGLRAADLTPGATLYTAHPD